MPQIVYYVYSYAQLVKNGEIGAGEKVNIDVPTGNFGNILAAYYAKRIGLPVAKLICASNKNKVLYDFFATGVYDRNREFYVTSSPSMDILISSNLERLIYQIAGCSAEKDSELMASLIKTGKYELTDEMREQLEGFYGNYATEEDTAAAIRKLYEKTGYVIDTHTAVAAAIYDKYVSETGDHTKTLIASTASPFKFARSVMTAIEGDPGDMDEFALIDRLSEISGVKEPAAVTELRTAPVRHKNECDRDQMAGVIKNWLGIR